MNTRARTRHSFPASIDGSRLGLPDGRARAWRSWALPNGAASTGRHLIHWSSCQSRHHERHNATDYHEGPHNTHKLDNIFGKCTYGRTRALRGTIHSVFMSVAGSDPAVGSQVIEIEVDCKDPAAEEEQGELAPIKDVDAVYENASSYEIPLNDQEC